MAKFEKVNDKWKDLRKDLYGNAEPKVVLEAITIPVTYPAKHKVGNRVDDLTDRVQPPIMADMVAGPIYIDAKAIEQLPAIAAGTSYGSKEKLSHDTSRAINLNKTLIRKGHLTPLEAIQFNFHISGISKACGAQISRHRVGQGHVSASRRFQSAEAAYVYPPLDYMDDRSTVITALTHIETVYRKAHAFYKYLHGEAVELKSGEFAQDHWLTLHKEDRRLVIPVASATERSWFINVRALRDFFKLRLAADAEWEIRRVAWMMYELVRPLLPSLFEDIIQENWKEYGMAQLPASAFKIDEPYDPDNEENTGWTPSPEVMKTLAVDPAPGEDGLVISAVSEHYDKNGVYEKTVTYHRPLRDNRLMQYQTLEHKEGLDPEAEKAMLEEEKKTLREWDGYASKTGRDLEHLKDYLVSKNREVGNLTAYTVNKAKALYQMRRKGKDETD